MSEHIKTTLTTELNEEEGTQKDALQLEDTFQKNNNSACLSAGGFSSVPYTKSKCQLISLADGWEMDKLPGTTKGSSLKAHLPAREAFETADALFTVEKRELFYPRSEFCQ